MESMLARLELELVAIPPNVSVVIISACRCNSVLELPARSAEQENSQDPDARFGGYRGQLNNYELAANRRRIGKSMECHQLCC